MTETNNTGDKTIHVPQQRKSLGLKPRGVERDTVRQSFSHGRTNTVQVERKKRRIVMPGETAKAEAPEPEPQRPAPEPVKMTPRDTIPHEPPKPSPRAGLVLRQLSGDEIDARARALADARVHEAEERRQAEEQAERRKIEAERQARERDEAERRKAEEETRRKAEETVRARAEDTARRRLGDEVKPADAGAPGEQPGAARPAKTLKEGEVEDDDRSGLRGRVKTPRRRRAEAGQARRGAPPRQADARPPRWTIPSAPARSPRSAAGASATGPGRTRGRARRSSAR